MAASLAHPPENSEVRSTPDRHERMKILLSTFVPTEKQDGLSEEDSLREGADQVTSELTHRALDRQAYYKRVHTFHPLTWFAKPSWLSPLHCARYGWENVSTDMLHCATCRGYISGHLPQSNDLFVYKQCLKRLQSAVIDGHHTCCSWRSHPCPESYMEVDVSNTAEVLQELQTRVGELEVLGARLPTLPSTLTQDMDLTEENMEHLHSLCAGVTAVSPDLMDEDGVDLSVRTAALLLAVCGWSIKGSASCGILHCDFCNRDGGLWNFFSEAEPPTGQEVQQKQSQDVLVSDTSGSQKEAILDQSRRSPSKDDANTESAQLDTERCVDDIQSDKTVEQIFSEAENQTEKNDRAEVPQNAEDGASDSEGSSSGSDQEKHDAVVAKSSLSQEMQVDDHDERDDASDVESESGSDDAEHPEQLQLHHDEDGGKHENSSSSQSDDQDNAEVADSPVMLVDDHEQLEESGRGEIPGRSHAALDESSEQVDDADNENVNRSHEEDWQISINTSKSSEESAGHDQSRESHDMDSDHSSSDQESGSSYNSDEDDDDDEGAQPVPARPADDDVHLIIDSSSDEDAEAPEGLVAQGNPNSSYYIAEADHSEDEHGQLQLRMSNSDSSEDHTEHEAVGVDYVVQELSTPFHYPDDYQGENSGSNTGVVLQAANNEEYDPVDFDFDAEEFGGSENHAYVDPEFTGTHTDPSDSVGLAGVPLNLGSDVQSGVVSGHVSGQHEGYDSDDDLVEINASMDGCNDERPSQGTIDLVSTDDHITVDSSSAEDVKPSNVILVDSSLPENNEDFFIMSTDGCNDALNGGSSDEDSEVDDNENAEEVDDEVEVAEECIEQGEDDDNTEEAVDYIGEAADVAQDVVEDIDVDSAEECLEVSEPEMDVTDATVEFTPPEEPRASIDTGSDQVIECVEVTEESTEESFNIAEVSVAEVAQEGTGSLGNVANVEVAEESREPVEEIADVPVEIGQEKADGGDKLDVTSSDVEEAVEVTECEETSSEPVLSSESRTGATSETVKSGSTSASSDPVKHGSAKKGRFSVDMLLPRKLSQAKSNTAKSEPCTESTAPHQDVMDSVSRSLSGGSDGAHGDNDEIAEENVTKDEKMKTEPESAIEDSNDDGTATMATEGDDKVQSRTGVLCPESEIASQEMVNTEKDDGDSRMAGNSVIVDKNGDEDEPESQSEQVESDITSQEVADAVKDCGKMVSSEHDIERGHGNSDSSVANNQVAMEIEGDGDELKNKSEAVYVQSVVPQETVDSEKLDGDTVSSLHDEERAEADGDAEMVDDVAMETDGDEERSENAGKKRDHSASDDGDEDSCHRGNEPVTTDPQPKRRKLFMQRTYFHPLKEHKLWCPWVAPPAAVNPGDPSAAVSIPCDMAGWKKLLNVLLAQTPQSINDESFSSSFVKNTPSHESLYAIRKLFQEWLSP